MGVKFFVRRCGRNVLFHFSQWIFVWRLSDLWQNPPQQVEPLDDHQRQPICFSLIVLQKQWQKCWLHFLTGLGICRVEWRSQFPSRIVRLVNVRWKYSVGSSPFLFLIESLDPGHDVTVFRILDGDGHESSRLLAWQTFGPLSPNQEGVQTPFLQWNSHPRCISGKCVIYICKHLKQDIAFISIQIGLFLWRILVPATKIHKKIILTPFFC